MTSASRATVAISAHYVPARIPFLATVLEAILDWQILAVKVVLVSNDPAIMSEAAIAAVQRKFAAKGWSLELAIATGLAHPYHLTWHHKQMIPAWVSTAAETGDYFIYLEDDMVLTNENLAYFSRYLEPLRKHGLVPGFLRYELRGQDKYSVDMTDQQIVSISPTVGVDHLKFLCATNPYWAGFILDKALAQEHLASDSSDLARSERLSKWGVRERAAMGLTWDAVPSRHKSRYAVALADGHPAAECLIWHCAQNYNTMSDSRFATLPINEVFVEGNVGLLVARAARKVGRLFK